MKNGRRIKGVTMKRKKGKTSALQPKFMPIFVKIEGK